MYKTALMKSHRTQRNEVVHLTRVEEVQDVHLVQNGSGSWDQRRTAHFSVRVLRVEQETRELSFLHGQQPQFQSSQCHVCKRSINQKTSLLIKQRRKLTFKLIK